MHLVSFLLLTLVVLVESLFVGPGSIEVKCFHKCRNKILMRIAIVVILFLYPHQMELGVYTTSDRWSIVKVSVPNSHTSLSVFKLSK